MEKQQTWQSIREKEIKSLYELNVKNYEGAFHYSYNQFRRYVTQADLGPVYVDAPSEPPQEDDIKEDIFLYFF
jgi:hypothetical protein